MPLNQQQRAALEAAAEREGIDPAELIAAAEADLAEREGEAKPDAASTKPGSAEQPKLFQYHLAFVKVREVRANWLGLTDPFPGDDEVAAAWAARFAAAAPAPDDGSTD